MTDDMRFRTEIDIRRGSFAIGHDRPVVLLGSCFTDHVGARMALDGFDVTANPFGPMYNPVSLTRLIDNAMSGKRYSRHDFITDAEGIAHCLDFASRYCGADADALSVRINSEIEALQIAIEHASTLILTLGSAFVYTMTDGDADGAVGNCHKFPASTFSRLALPVAKIEAVMRKTLTALREQGKNIILTVSPIRHLADGLHGNQLSKSRLLLACDMLGDLADYFPSYEIMLDDLRDYRFYAADMRHPSEVAADYIYDKFSSAYFTDETLRRAAVCRAEALRKAHRPIIN